MSAARPRACHAAWLAGALVVVVAGLLAAPASAQVRRWSALEWPEGTGRFDASVRHVKETDGKLRLGIEFDDPDLVDKLLGAWYRRGGQ